MSYKYKVGDNVICLNHPSKNHYAEPGVGWKEGLVFKVTSTWTSNEDLNIYYGGFNGHGVYERWLEINEPKEWD